MKHILTTTAIAAALTLGSYGLAAAQGLGTNPGSGTTGSGMPAQSPSGQSGSSGMSSGSTMGQSGGMQAAQQATRMSDDQIRNVLKTNGYSDISGLERDGDTFKVKEAKRYGEKANDLRINASTGQVRDEKKLSEDQAKNLLRDRGYSDISDVKLDGNTITANAKRDGNKAKVKIDAQSGMVTQQQASN